MSIRTFCKTYDIGRTSTYAEIKAGRLKARKAGRRTVIAQDDAEEWLGLLPAFHEGLKEPSPDVYARRDASGQSLQPTRALLPRDPTTAARATAREDEISS
jgi:hypothetical protein